MRRAIRRRARSPTSETTAVLCIPRAIVPDDARVFADFPGEGSTRRRIYEARAAVKPPFFLARDGFSQARP